MLQSTKSNKLKEKDSQHIFFGSIICTIGALFYCYEFVLRILPGTLQNELIVAFGNISATTFGQLSAMYYFAYSPMQLPVGMLMDRFGPRRLLTFACLLCTFGSYLFSYSSSLMIASTGRFLVGLGSSFAFVGVLSLALNWLPKRYFSLVAGLVTTLGMLGLVYGEVQLTNMAISLGLNYVLLTTVIFGLILSVLIFLIARDGPTVEGSIAKNHPLREFFQEVWCVLTSSEVWIIGIVGACLYTSLSVFGELWGKAYLELAHHLTKIEAARTISVLFLGWAVGAPLAGYWSDRVRKRKPTLLIGATMSLLCICIVLYWPNLSYGSLQIWLFLYGVFSGTEIIVFIMAKEQSQQKLSGTVFAVTNMIVTLGGVIFQPLVGKLLDYFSKSTSMIDEHIYQTSDYQLALSIIPVSLLFIFLLAFFLKDTST